ncbi:MAG: GNAT family N-acetyltransferase [Egibacteraceae bacterium]
MAADDADFCRSMLYEAAFWRPGRTDCPRPPRDEALQAAELALYVRGWGRAGDRGLVATAGTQRLGAAWFRLFSHDQPGYGFVDPQTPELTIAVLAALRGKGVGRALLAASLLQARLDGFEAVSLSVEPDNPALALYQSAGFRMVEAVGTAWIMLARLSRSSSGRLIRTRQIVAVPRRAGDKHPD